MENMIMTWTDRYVLTDTHVHKQQYRHTKNTHRHTLSLTQSNTNSYPWTGLDDKTNNYLETIISYFQMTEPVPSVCLSVRPSVSLTPFGQL